MFIALLLLKNQSCLLARLTTFQSDYSLLCFIKADNTFSPDYKYFIIENYKVFCLQEEDVFTGKINRLLEKFAKNPSNTGLEKKLIAACRLSAHLFANEELSPEEVHVCE